MGVAVVVVAMLVWSFATGSDGKEDQGQPAPSSSSSSLPPTSESSSAPSSGSAAPSPSTTSYINAAPGETPPVRPPDELSDAGLEAFVRYFAMTIDWAAASMDTALLEQASSKSCGLCQAIINNTKVDAAASRRYEGSRYTMTRVLAFPDLSSDGKQRTAGFWWDASEFTIYNPDGSIVRQDPPAFGDEYDVGAVFDNGRWWIISMFLMQRTG
jgi:hypothetical protein